MAAGFRTTRQRHAAALLNDRPLGFAELLDAVGGDRRSLRRQLDRLSDEGLLDYAEVGQPAPGKAAGLWSLTRAGRSAAGLRPHAGDPTPPSALPSDGGHDGTDEDEESDFTTASTVRAGQVWINAALGAATRAALRALLVDGRLTAAATFIAQLDGDAVYLFVFDPDVVGAA